MITIIHAPYGCRIDCDCVVQHGVRLTPERCDDNCNLTGNYLKGKTKPNYPVPVVRSEQA